MELYRERRIQEDKTVLEPQLVISFNRMKIQNKKYEKNNKKTQFLCSAQSANAARAIFTWVRLCRGWFFPTAKVRIS